jgi:hypothetical protein
VQISFLQCCFYTTNTNFRWSAAVQMAKARDRAQGSALVNQLSRSRALARAYDRRSSMTVTVADLTHDAAVSHDLSQSGQPCSIHQSSRMHTTCFIHAVMLHYSAVPNILYRRAANIGKALLHTLFAQLQLTCKHFDAL